MVQVWTACTTWTTWTACLFELGACFTDGFGDRPNMHEAIRWAG